MANQGSKWLYQLMANPHTRGEEVSEEDMGMEPASRDDDYLRLRIKKKQQNHLLRSMLEQGGYGDLAKMTTIRGAKPVYSTDPSDEGEY